MNIDDMPAGPEMDRLIAEHVMQWRLVKIPKYRDETFWCDFSGRPIVPEGGIGFSGNMGWAWDMMCTKVAWEPRVGYSDEFHGWFCDFEKMSHGNSHADTAPLAICRAMLKALSVTA